MTAPDKSTVVSQCPAIRLGLTKAPAAGNALRLRLPCPPSGDVLAHRLQSRHRLRVSQLDFDVVVPLDLGVNQGLFPSRQNVEAGNKQCPGRRQKSES